jgi:hypothetical protein
MGFIKVLEEKIRKGYKVSSVRANFKVYWLNQKTNTEIKIILPEIALIK